MIKENIERCYENNKSCFENSQIHPIGVLKHHQCFRTPKVGCVTMRRLASIIIAAVDARDSRLDTMQIQFGAVPFAGKPGY